MLYTVLLENVRVTAIDDVASVSFTFNGSVRKKTIYSNGPEWFTDIRPMFAPETLSPCLLQNVRDAIADLANEATRNADQTGEWFTVSVDRLRVNDDSCTFIEESR